MATLGMRMRDLRLSKQLGQKEIGALIGVGYSSVRKYESGERTPNPDAIIKLASFFDVSTDYLLGNTDERHATPPAQQLRTTLTAILGKELADKITINETNGDILKNGKTVANLSDNAIALAIATIRDKLIAGEDKFNIIIEEE